MLKKVSYFASLVEFLFEWKVYCRKGITFFHLIRINDISNFKVTSFKKTFKGFVKVFWTIRQLAYRIRKKYRHVKSKQILCRIFCNSNLLVHELIKQELWKSRYKNKPSYILWNISKYTRWITPRSDYVNQLGIYRVSGLLFTFFKRL